MRNGTLAGGSVPAGGTLPPHWSSRPRTGWPPCRESKGRVLFTVEFDGAAWEAVVARLREVAFWSDIPMEDPPDPIRCGQVLSTLGTLLRRTGARVTPGSDPLDGMKPAEGPSRTIKVSMHRAQFSHFWSLARQLWPWEFDDDTKTGLWDLSPGTRGQLLLGMARLVSNPARLTTFEFRANLRFLHLLDRAQGLVTKMAGTSCDGKHLLFICEHFLRSDIRGRRDFLRRLGSAMREQRGLQLIAVGSHVPYVERRIEAAKQEYLDMTGVAMPLSPLDENTETVVWRRHPFLKEEVARIAEALRQARAILPKADDDGLLELVHTSFMLDHLRGSGWEDVVRSAERLFDLRILGVDTSRGRVVDAVRSNSGGFLC